MKFEGRSGITDDQTREAARVADEFRGRQATMVVASHSTGTEDCIELLAMLGLTQTPEGQQLPPYTA